MTLDYLAGLIDGEGNLGLTRGGVRNAPGFRRAKLTISMTTPAPLIEAQTSFGGRLHGPYHYGDPTRKPFYVWQLSRKAELLSLLPDLIPRLLVKREDAQRILKYLEANPLHQGRRTN